MAGRSFRCEKGGDLMDSQTVTFSLSCSQKAYLGWPSKIFDEKTELLIEKDFINRRIRDSSNISEDILFQDKPEIAKRNRGRYSLFLIELSKFLKSINYSKLARGELVEIALALRELDNGTVRDFLKPSYSPQKQEHPGDKWGFRVQFCIAVEWLCQNGHSRKEACKKISLVAKPLIGFIAPNSADIASTIENWHRQLDRGKVRNEVAKSSFANGETLVQMHAADFFKKHGRYPTVDELAAKIALGAVELSILAATQDEHDKTFEQLRALKQKHARHKG